MASSTAALLSTACAVRVGQPRGHAPGFGTMSVCGCTPAGRPDVNGRAAAAALGPAVWGVVAVSPGVDGQLVRPCTTARRGGWTRRAPGRGPGGNPPKT